MKRESLQFPIELADIPRAQWPVDGYHRVRVLRNRQFLVQVFEDGGTVRLSVNRTEWDERRNSWREDISWDDLQRLKREAGYGDKCAVEIYPPDDEVVNVANMRHLFLMEPPAFMWKKRREAQPAPV